MFIIINLTYMPTGSRYLFFTSIYTVTKIFIASYVGIAKKKKKKKKQLEITEMSTEEAD